MVPACWALALVLAQSPASPQQLVAARRPAFEISTWVGLGGGGLTAERTRSVFDARVGGDLTLATCDEGAEECTGDSRFGPFLEAASASFASATAVGGVELFLGALRMFYYTGEGVLALRLGAGWTWRRHLPGREAAPVASGTLTYGYRAPFSLQDYVSQRVDVQARRPKSRYMLGARLWLNAQVDVVRPTAWQVSGGIEFEPVGALRYLTGVGY